VQTRFIFTWWNELLMFVVWLWQWQLKFISAWWLYGCYCSAKNLNDLHELVKSIDRIEHKTAMLQYLIEEKYLFRSLRIAEIQLVFWEEKYKLFEEAIKEKAVVMLAVPYEIQESYQDHLPHFDVTLILCEFCYFLENLIALLYITFTLTYEISRLLHTKPKFPWLLLFNNICYEISVDFINIYFNVLVPIMQLIFVHKNNTLITFHAIFHF